MRATSSCRTAMMMSALGMGLVTAGAGAQTINTTEPSGPEVVLQDFLKAMYSRDASAAYDLLATADREVKTLEDYASETAAFDGPALILSRELAAGIQFKNTTVHVVKDRADVVFDAVLPNANDPAVDELVHGFDQDRLNALTQDQIEALRGDIRERAQTGLLPVLRSEGEAWNLVRENGEWRVFQNWAEAVEVTFDAVTFHDLGWEFEPLRTRVMAKHGETIQMAYRAKNIGTSEVTGKARHIIGPEGEADYLNIIACFCFLEETLAPGEEVELPLTFRVDFDAPEDLTEFTVKYEFYPADRFPGDEQADLQVQG